MFVPPACKCAMGATDTQNTSAELVNAAMGEESWRVWKVPAWSAGTGWSPRGWDLLAPAVATG